MTSVRLLSGADIDVLAQVAEGVFDFDVNPRWWAEFISDARHHLAVAIDDGVVVGMASGVHYVHPDKAPQLFVNEVAVAPSHHRQGIGKQMLDALLQHGRELGCSEAWVATAPTNAAARGLYESAGGVADAEPFVMYTFPL